MLLIFPFWCGVSFQWDLYFFFFFLLRSYTFVLLWDAQRLLLCL